MNGEQDSVEEVLRLLAPVPSSLHVPRVMYLAGQASAMAARPRHPIQRRLIWPCLATVSLVLAGVFATAWAFSPDREVVERVVFVEKKVSTPVSDEPIDVRLLPEALNGRWRDYAMIRELVVNQGFEGLPEPQRRSLSDLGSRSWDSLHDPPVGASPEG